MKKIYLKVLLKIILRVIFMTAFISIIWWDDLFGIKLLGIKIVLSLCFIMTFFLYNDVQILSAKQKFHEVSTNYKNREEQNEK